MGLTCISGTLVGLIGTMYSIGYAVVSLLVTGLVDIYGRKKVVIPGLLYMCLIETIIIAFVRSYYVLLPMTFLFGASGTFRVSLTYLYIMDLTQ
jgi:MFS family permease